MKTLTAFLAAISICVLFAACSACPPQAEDTGAFESEGGGMYTFQKMEDTDQLNGSSKLMGIIDGFPPDYQEQCILIEGKLLRLFGDPHYETANTENQYSYRIAAADADGHTYSFEVYSGPSGPAIGASDFSEESKAAARALIDEIQAATPSDFHYEGYYPDTLAKITMGIKDGKAYYSEVEMTDPGEIARMWELLA